MQSLPVCPSMVSLQCSLLVALGLLALGCTSNKPRVIHTELEAPTDMEFTAAFDGSTQRYMLCLPQAFEPARTHDLLIGFHGHGSDRHQYATDPRGECKGARDAAAGHDMIFVSPDYRAATSWMGPAAEADTVQLIGDLKKRYKVGKVFLVGGSMGGTAVLTFTALHPELVDGVVSENGTANLLEYDVTAHDIQLAIKDAFGGLKNETPQQFKARRPDVYKARSAEFHPDKFTMPLAITAGGNDQLVPPQSVLRLAEAVSKHNRHLVFFYDPGGGHQTSHEYTVAALEFVIETARR